MPLNLTPPTSSVCTPMPDLEEVSEVIGDNLSAIQCPQMHVVPSKKPLITANKKYTVAFCEFVARTQQTSSNGSNKSVNILIILLLFGLFLFL